MSDDKQEPTSTYVVVGNRGVGASVTILVPVGLPFVCGQLARFRSPISRKYGEITAASTPSAITPNTEMNTQLSRGS